VRLTAPAAPTWGDHDQLQTIKARVDGTIVPVNVLLLDAPLLEKPGGVAVPLASLRGNSRNEVSFAVDGFDDAAGGMHLSYAVYAPPITQFNQATGAPTGRSFPQKSPLRSGRVFISGHWETAAVSYDPAFEARFPQLWRNWPELSDVAAADIAGYATRRDRMSWASKRAKILDLEIQGEDIALFGSVALLLTLWYFAAHLSAMCAHASRARERFRDAIASAPSMWIGLQDSADAIVLLVASVVAAPAAVYFGYFQIGSVTWLAWTLMVACAALSVRVAILVATLRSLAK
jgi:hypothetical protein